MNSVVDANNDTPSGTRTIKASEFKPKRLQLMNEVADGGGEIVITKNWKLVSRLVPYRELSKSLFGVGRCGGLQPPHADAGCGSQSAGR